MNWILVNLILAVTSQVDGTGDFVSNDIHMITIYYDVHLHLLLQFFFLQSKHGSIRKTTDNEHHVSNEKYDMIRRPVQELNLFGDFFMSTGDVADSFSYHMFNDINTYVSSGNYLIHIDVDGTIYALTKIICFVTGI